MKTKILIMAFAFLGFAASSQTINGIQIAGIKSEYLNVTVTKKIMSNKVVVIMDFGQVDKLFNTKDAMILDRNGKSVIFNSEVNVLNFFTLLGYEFVTRNIVANSSNMIYTSILLRRTDISKKGL